MPSLGQTARTSLSVRLVRDAVEELEKSRSRVSVSLLISHFQRRYPVERHPELFKVQLLEQLAKAVKLGWLRRCADDTYTLSTSRWEAAVGEFGYD